MKMQQYKQNEAFNQNLFVFISMELIYLIVPIFSADRMQKVQWSLIFPLQEQRFPHERWKVLDFLGQKQPPEVFWWKAILIPTLT